ncbi:uncharacterized protein LOC128448593 isoform X4 [Pleuronectes platessa]|uniref:uncharacterized protein LOC128448593 isoform X4 n=1 Tax=Pleuronectes platessa TaxID=8262 RepID=UPI00232A2B0C|nr:uncharacterized protein LOC128448593 isoform X4 [Pleuronectes platessa]
MSSSSSFGSATPSQPTSGSSFGSATAAKPVSGSLFGSATPSQPTSSSSFGSATPSQPTSDSLFGSATAAKPVSGSLFGIATPSQPTSGSLFGSATAAKRTSSSSFGSAALAQHTSGSLVGSTTPSQFTSGFSFGSSTAAKPTHRFSVRTATPAKPKSSSLFGSSTAAKPTSSFSFGSPTLDQPTINFSFGSPTLDQPTISFSFGSPTAAQPTTSSPATALEALSRCTAPTSTTCKVKAQTFKFPVNQNGELKDTDSKEVFGFPKVIPLGPRPVNAAVKPPSWRNVQWTEERRSSLMEAVGSYTPGREEVTQARVLLLGPVGSGKSSFISSVHSVFNGRVTNRAMVGASSTSFTKKLQSFTICGQKNKVSTKLVLCDSMGLGDGEMTGLTLHDILSVIKGHVPEGHKFCPDQAVRSETGNYVKWPSLKDKIHCVAFVLDASKITTYPKGLRASFQQLREHISDMGIHQVALLTHVDEICARTAADVSMVYASEAVKQTMSKAADLMGMSTSYIVPVKNYSSELDLDVNTDVLLLSAVEHILQYVDLFFQDNTTQETESEKA